MAEELKACECGSTDSSIGYEAPQCYWVECGDCGHKTAGESRRGLAIHAWNTRAQLPNQGGEAVEVVGYLAAGTFLGTDKTVCDAGRLFFGSDKVEEVMTVAQHQRILAAATHPADQVADDLTMVKVSRELLERIVKRGIRLPDETQHQHLEELSAILEAK